MNIPLIVGIGILIFSIYILRHAVVHYRKALASQKWPSVQGKLIDVHLWGKSNIDGEIKDVDKLGVKYEYQTQDRTHVGTTTAFFTLMYPETFDFATSHPLNSYIEVYYNPLNPTESVLIPGPRKDKRYSDLILGILGVLTGMVVAIFGWTGILD